MHCVRRDLLWPPLLPGSSILVGIHLSACATHTLHTHGDCKRAASIVAPLRQTQTDIFFKPPPLISLQCSSCKDGEREKHYFFFFFFFNLGSLVQPRCGEGGVLQTDITGVRSQCLSHTGSAPAHGACNLPAHTAWALGCSAGNNQRPALD